MAKFVSAFIIGLALLAQAVTAQNTTPLTSDELNRRTVERRAVDAVIWGMPVVSLDALRQAYFRNGTAKYGDIIWWPKGSGWKNQSLTPNTSVRYLYVFLNTKQDGPVVLDLPAAANGSSFLGTIADAWQVPLTDVGFEGKGGKYLVLPPDYTGEVPTGYIPVRPKTYNTFTVPHFNMLEENNVRRGFLQDEQYLRLSRECAGEGIWLAGLFETAYAYSWREDELLALRVGQLDLSPETASNRP
jgi:hypothetical protein